MHGGTTQPGHYEVRTETRLGVPVAAIYWASGHGPASCLTTLAPERVPLLAEALNAWLASGPADVR
jgi:hypothetical protein